MATTPRLRRLTRGVYTTASRRADPVKGFDIIVECHEVEPHDSRRPIRGQRNWWTWKLVGGETDGKAYHARSAALMAALMYREGRV